MRPGLLSLVRRVPCVLLVIASVPLVVSCDTGLAGTGRGSILQELDAERMPRPFGARLSISTEYRECDLDPAAEEAHRCEKLPGDAVPPARAVHITRLAGRAAPNTTDPDTLHAAALADLLWADSAGKSLARSITFLETVVRLSPHPASAYTDLAAAHLVRAERMHNARDLPEAVEAAKSALELEPKNTAAWYNLALALDLLGVEGEAREAWKRFRMLERRSGWATEAERRTRALEQVREPPRPPSPGASPAAVAAFVASAPQDARLLGWDRLLPEWGDAVLKGDSARAAARLRLAGMLAEALERRPGGDATLADAVRAIRSRAGDAAATRTLARAHLDFGAGAAAFARLEHEAADSSFRGVLAARPPSPALVRWAAMFHAAALVLAADYRSGIEVLRPLAVRGDTARHPAFAGRVRGALATALLRTGEPERARAMARDAARLLERAGETEHVGGMQYVAAQAEFNLGATLDAYASIHQALRTLRPFRRSVWLSNLLSAAARSSESEGLNRAARSFQDERVAVARRSGNPAVMAEAHLGRAQALIAAGEGDAADDDIAAGGALVGALRPGRTRLWLATDLRMARAALAFRTDPRRAAAMLDTVVSDSGGTRTALRRLGALVQRAEARLAIADEGGAVADLDSATRLVEAQRSSVTRASFRASLAAAAQGVFDRLILLKLGAGDTVAALGYLERSRTAFGGAASAASPRGRRWSMPPGQVAVEYAMIGDTLLVWTIADTAVVLTRRTVDRVALARGIENARTSLELRLDGKAGPELARLYETLVRPVRERIGGEGTRLVVLADGEIAAVPFAALYDARRRRYLVQDHPLRFAGSLGDALRTPRGRAGSPPRALLVADPAFDARLYPGLDRLDGARAEVAAIRAGYRDPEVLADTAVRRPRVEAALGQAEVVHFAGHALFDDERPERSVMLLASSDDTYGSDDLAATDLEGMDLRHVRLFVLSACQTLRSHSGRSGGFAGFAGALLGAGAGGVAGSLWRVDDDLTRPLMIEFHREYRKSGNGPDALRAAQLAMLRSGDPALASPAAWAGFRYAGN
jgi:CHAT domain-containing protein